MQQREDYELLVIKSTVDEEVHGAIICQCCHGFSGFMKIGQEERSGRAEELQCQCLKANL